jgi:hypothetical protein
VFSGAWINWGPPATPTNYDPNDPTGDTSRTVGYPAVTWNWSPEESSDWEGFGQCSMPVSPDGKSDTTYQVQYTATSVTSPNATATAPYTMSVHNPLENFITINTNRPSSYRPNYS